MLEGESHPAFSRKPHDGRTLTNQKRPLVLVSFEKADKKDSSRSGHNTHAPCVSCRMAAEKYSFGRRPQATTL